MDGLVSKSEVSDCAVLLGPEALSAEGPPSVAGLDSGNLGGKAKVKHEGGAIDFTQRLPTELLARIFVFVSDQGHPVVLPLPLGTNLSWVLRHVCSRWRRVALNETSLWQWVSLVHANYQWPRWNIVALARHILPSHGPLSISLDYYHGHQKDIESPGNAFDTLIIPNAARLRRLSLGLTLSGVITFIPTLPCSFTALEYLKLCLSEGVPPGPSGQDESAPMFDMVPSLRWLMVSGHGNHISLWVQAQRIPWSQLTYLNLHGLSSLRRDELYHILRQCTSLTTCVLRTPSVRRREPALPANKITLPQLDSLKLDVHDPSFLDSFVLPSLVNLSIQGQYQPCPIMGIATLVNRSSCLLKTFYFREQGKEYYDETDPVDDLLVAMPSLVTLIFAHTLPDRVLEKIGHGELLPRLVNLTCFIVSPASFVDMVESRLRNGIPSERLKQAVGIYSVYKRGDSDMSPYHTRMENIRQAHGPDFRLVHCDHYLNPRMYFGA